MSFFSVVIENSYKEIVTKGFCLIPSIDNDVCGRDPGYSFLAEVS